MESESIPSLDKAPSQQPTLAPEEKKSAAPSKILSGGKERLSRPSGLSRVFNPPKLEKKHSSGDLISRLKTRKILGVGETDNGDIHRSKISQVLGHNEHLFVRLPKGFWVAHAVIGALISLEAAVCLFLPDLANSFGFLPPIAQNSLPNGIVRMLGSSLCGMSVFVWSLVGTMDKHYARTVLMSVSTYQVLCTFICIGTSISTGHMGGRWTKTITVIRAGLSVVCLVYFHQIGEPSSANKKTTPYHDNSSKTSKTEPEPLKSHAILQEKKIS